MHLINFCREKRTFSIRPNHVTQVQERKLRGHRSPKSRGRKEGREAFFLLREGRAWDTMCRVYVCVSMHVCAHIGIHSRIVPIPRWRENNVAPALAQGGCKHKRCRR